MFFLLIIVALWSYIAYRQYLVRSSAPTSNGKLLAVAGGAFGAIGVMVILPAFVTHVMPAAWALWVVPAMVSYAALAAIIVVYLYEWTLANEGVMLRQRLVRAGLAGFAVFVVVWYVWSLLYGLSLIVAWLTFLAFVLLIPMYWTRILSWFRNLL